MRRPVSTKTKERLFAVVIQGVDSRRRLSLTYVCRGITRFDRLFRKEAAPVVFIKPTVLGEAKEAVTRDGGHGCTKASIARLTAIYGVGGAGSDDGLQNSDGGAKLSCKRCTKRVSTGRGTKRHGLRVSPAERGDGAFRRPGLEGVVRPGCATAVVPIGVV